MNVNEMYQLVLYFCAKNSQQGYLSPSDFNLVINQAQISFTNYLLGEFQQYTPGRAVPTVQFGMNAITRQRLAPCIDLPTTLNIDSSGFAAYPYGFAQTDAMYIYGLPIYGGMQRIKFVQQDYLYSYLKSYISPINKHPLYMVESQGFRFYPNSEYNGVNIPGYPYAKLSFVKYPPLINWAYTLDVNGLPVYDPDNSTDCAYQEVDQLEVVTRALNIIGVNLQFSEVRQYSEQVQTKGQ
jgi:hypothetical protein